MKNKKQRGLTLIELLAVIAIIAILFVLLIPQISNAIEKSRETGIITDFRDYERAARSYFIDNGSKRYATAALINPHLDKQLKFENGNNSNKKSPLDSNYIITTLGVDVISITTKKENKKYALYVIYSNGEINSYTSGFGFVDEFENIITDENFEYLKLNEEELMLISYKKEGGDVVIPNQIEGKKVVSIGYEAFKSKKITSVKLPDQLTKIGGSSFRDNELTKVDIPPLVTGIDGAAFSNNKISDLNFLGNNIAIIAQDVFRKNLLTNVVFPSSMKEIRNNAFLENPLVSYTIQGNPNIGTTAFPTTSLRK